MKNKILSLFLVTGLVLSLAGCGNAENKESEEKQSSAVSSEQKEESKEEEATEVEEESASILPWTGEEITYTLFYYDQGLEMSDDPSLPAIAALNEMFGNIKFELETLPLADYDIKVPLYLANGDFPDLMVIREAAEQVKEYGPNGVLFDWAAYEEYMPNYKKVVEEVPSFNNVLDDEGHRYVVATGVSDRDLIQRAMVVNKSLLDELGIAIPETQEAFLEACRKVKEETGYNPIVARNGFGHIYSMTKSMYKNFGDAALQYYEKEGIWDFGPTREDSELKDWLTFMHLLWEEELISREITSITVEEAFEKMYNGEFAFTFDYHENFAYYRFDREKLVPEITDVEYEIMPIPKGTGKWIEVTGPRESGDFYWGLVANPNVEHPEVLAACIDFLFTDEFSLFRNFGLEGVTYEFDENGNPQFTDNMKMVCNNYSGTESLNDYGFNRHFLFSWGNPIQDVWEMKNLTQDLIDDMREIDAKLDSGEWDARYSYGRPKMSEEDSEEISAIMAPVETYLNECIPKFIVGEMDLEKDWDTFMDKLVEYGDTERVCEILNSYEMPKVSGNWR